MYHPVAKEAKSSRYLARTRIYRSLASAYGVLNTVSYGIWIVLAVWPLLMIGIDSLQRVNNSHKTSPEGT